MVLYNGVPLACSSLRSNPIQMIINTPPKQTATQHIIMNVNMIINTNMINNMHMNMIMCWLASWSAC